MHADARHFVRAFLPLIPLAFCHGWVAAVAMEAPRQRQRPSVRRLLARRSAPATVNRAPTISGAIVDDARVGATYDYQPAAADPDGDALRFTAANLPPWASLDPTNGRITGTPGDNDVGIYESITITVADASHQARTAPFSITVLQAADAGTGVASLQWEMPPSKVDGSPLDDLAGYRILYGRDSDDLDQSVLITDPAMTSYEFSTLDRHLVLRGGRRECRRSRRPADHGRLRSPSDRRPL